MDKEDKYDPVYIPPRRGALSISVSSTGPHLWRSTRHVTHILSEGQIID